MSISYTGYDTKYLTMEGTDVTIGSLVTISPDSKVVDAKNGEPFIGVAITKRDNVIGVQEHGYFECKYVGEKPSNCYCRLISNGDKAVKIDNVKGLKYYKIIKIDENNNIVGFML